MDAYILEISDLLAAISRRRALEMEDLRITAASIDKHNVIETSQDHDNTSRLQNCCKKLGRVPGSVYNNLSPK